MPRHKASPRARFRQKESRRIMDSASLADRFPKLKSLTVELSFFPPDGENRSGQIKYVVNLDHAKSVFRFDCLNKECVRGDFDLSDVLAKAIARRQKNIEGEMRCHGWRNKDMIRKVYCRNLLRYKLSLAY
jgi:hypothetical protein